MAATKYAQLNFDFLEHTCFALCKFENKKPKTGSRCIRHTQLTSISVSKWSRNSCASCCCFVENSRCPFPTSVL